jgi:hypothetical protein
MVPLYKYDIWKADSKGYIEWILEDILNDHNSYPEQESSKVFDLQSRSSSSRSLHSEEESAFSNRFYHVDTVPPSSFHKYRRNLMSADNQPVPDSELPAGIVNQSHEERNYLKLHRCRDGGEAYSASYLTTKQHIIEHNTFYNLTWVNCEMGSFIMMSPTKKIGAVIQTLDVLDFSVVHLSAYERLQRRWHKLIGRGHNIKPVIDSVGLIRNRSLLLRESDTPSAVPEVLRTIAIMPFLASENGYFIVLISIIN